MTLNYSVYDSNSTQRKELFGTIENMKKAIEKISAISCGSVVIGKFIFFDTAVRLNVTVATNIKENFEFVVLAGVIVTGFFGCSSAPKLYNTQIRSWNSALVNEYPKHKAVIAHYKKNNFELTYLAARHVDEMGSDTLNLVKVLFDQFKFNVLLIEPIPYASGQSPSWLLAEAKKGQTEKFISGGESALASIFADQKHIPFFGGEPSHRDIYDGLKNRGYSNEDIIGFYTARQIPEWIREHESRIGLLDRKVPPFILIYCKNFSISKCPTLDDIKIWYKVKLGHELGTDVSNEEVAPIFDGKLFTQKISSDVGYIRDHFTLSLIEELLEKYKRVAVIYGAGHFVTLRKSLDSALGLPVFTEDTNASKVH